MKTFVLSLFLIASAPGAQITVCASGCAYATAQAALDASKDGDTIILAAGQNHGALSIPGNRHDLTFKSSLIDKYPRNYRMVRHDPSLARLTTITAGESGGWVSGTPGSATLVSMPGNVIQPHGMKIGDKVVIGGSRFSAYHCAIVNQPPYTTGACDASRVSFLNIRADTGLVNGMVIYLRGRTLPTPLQVGTPYYVVNFTRGGSVSNADKFQLSAQPGGAPIDIPQFDPYGQDLIVEAAPMPQQIGDVMYVVATPTPTTLQLSPTLGGPPSVWTQMTKGYNGSGLSVGFSVTRLAPVHDLTFDGIEVLPSSDFGVYYPIYISKDAGIEEGENYAIRILRCWIHGSDDQETFPMAMINIGGREVEIGWNVIENAYSTGNDTQGIGFLSTGNVWIHDNEIKGTAEGILSGGNIPWFAFRRNTTGIRVTRNYLWKPLKAYSGIVATLVGPTQFQLVSRYQGADCASVANNPNLGIRCFAYESDESDPANPVISRTEWANSAGASTFTVAGSAGQAGFIYLLNGVLHMDYNYSGSVTCPSGIVCTHVATPTFSPASTRLGIALIGSGGTLDGGFYQENRNVWSKNLLESKYGDNWLIEGNVFHRQSNCDGGGTCQDSAIQFTVAGNGSGGGEPVNYAVSSSNSIIRNNIFRHLSAGIGGVGKTFAINIGATGLAFEFAGFGKNSDNRVENNLFMDLGSTEYSAIFGGAILRLQNTDNWAVEHNTAIDVRVGFLADAVSAGLYRSNILVPYRSACPGGSCSSPSASSHIGVQNDTGLGPVPYFGGSGATSWLGAVASGNVDGTSKFLNNIVMNRSGFVYAVNRGTAYTSSTYLVQPDDPDRDPNHLFVNWQERNNAAPPNGLQYRAANYRLAPGMAAAYPAFDQRAIGADIDEIEALTGRNGIDVEKGLPTFADRTARQISIGSTLTVLSYLPNAAACTIKVWANPAYNGNPTVNITDAGADVLDGVIYVGMSGLQAGARYYGKRWCGSEVDVFNFITSQSTPSLQLQLAPPPSAVSCEVEYGPTKALGFTTEGVAVANGGCSLTAPSTAAYWRPAYLSAAGVVVSRGKLQRRGL